MRLLVPWIALCVGCAAPPPDHLFDEITDEALAGGDPVPLDPNEWDCDIVCVGAQFGVGAAVADVDGDGRLDLYLAGPSGGRLLFNRTVAAGAITFEPAQIPLPDVYVHGAAFGDLDGDGAPELLLATAEGLRGLRGAGGTLVAEPALTRVLQRTSSVTVGDLDDDGLLDVYVAEYGHAGSQSAKAGRGLLLINRGDLIFEDVATGWPGRHAWSGLIADLDGDRRLDLLIAAETWPELLENAPSALYFNDGNDDRGLPRLDDGAIASPFSRYSSPMGAAAADLDGDGLPEVVVTLIGPSLFLTRDPGAAPRELVGSSYFGPQTQAVAGQTSWGAAFHDFDGDGSFELLLAGGAPCVPEICDNASIPASQSSQLFRLATGRFGASTILPVPVAGGLAAAAGEQRGTRGLVLADLDGDGREELLLTPFRDRFRLYRSALGGGHPLLVLPRSGASAAIPCGLQVDVTVGSKVLRRTLTCGGNTHSQEQPALAFELPSGRAERVDAWWPSGLRQVLHDVPAGPLSLVEPVALRVPRRIRAGAPLEVAIDHPPGATITVTSSDQRPFTVETTGSGTTARAVAPTAPATLVLTIAVDGQALETRPLISVDP